MSDQNIPEDMQPPHEWFGKPPYPIPDLSGMDEGSVGASAEGEEKNSDELGCTTRSDDKNIE
jgi:hypothetical protein